MFLRLISLLLLFSIVFAINFPGRLSAEEAAELRKTCGRRPTNRNDDVVSDEKKSLGRPRNPEVHSSFGSRLTNRKEAPWVTSRGTIISKRHILWCAHCVPRLGPTSYKHFNTTIAMTCIGSSQFMNCTESPIMYRKVVGISYPETYQSGLGFVSDIAILTLDQDMEMSRYIYPACLGGYAINETESVTNFGYGYSTPEELAKGTDQANFLQTFKALRIRDNWKDGPILRGIDPLGAHSMSGDSGSGYYHQKDGIASVYAVNDGRANSQYGIVSRATRVSAHLYWIKYVTGIDAKDEDMEFSGYLYRIKINDHRKKKTFYAGASHPSRIEGYINRK